jgi:hypothetical protein
VVRHLIGRDEGGTRRESVAKRAKGILKKAKCGCTFRVWGEGGMEHDQETECDECRRLRMAYEVVSSPYPTATVEYRRWEKHYCEALKVVEA